MTRTRNTRRRWRHWSCPRGETRNPASPGPRRVGARRAAARGTRRCLAWRSTAPAMATMGQSGEGNCSSGPSWWLQAGRASAAGHASWRRRGGATSGPGGGGLLVRSQPARSVRAAVLVPAPFPAGVPAARARSAHVPPHIGRTSVRRRRSAPRLHAGRSPSRGRRRYGSNSSRIAGMREASPMQCRSRMVSWTFGRC